MRPAAAISWAIIRKAFWFRCVTSRPPRARWWNLPEMRVCVSGSAVPDTRDSLSVSPKLKCAAESVPFTPRLACNLLIQNVFGDRCDPRSPAAGAAWYSVAGTSLGTHGHMSGAAKDAPVRLGVIGVGIMGSNHARVLADLSGVQIVGIADAAASHRALVAQIVGCAVCDDVDELLALGIDAAVIAAPTHLHHDIALTCVRRGVHVLVEKPIASNVEEGRTIVAAAERAGVTLMVGHVERFNPAVQAIKGAIKGEDILSIAITGVCPF